jgi:hypothetical protein
LKIWIKLYICIYIEIMKKLNMNKVNKKKNERRKIKWMCGNCGEVYLTKPRNFCLICGEHGRIREIREIEWIDSCNRCGSDIYTNVYYEDRDEREESTRKERLEAYRKRLLEIAQIFDIQSLSSNNIDSFELERELLEKVKRNKQTIANFSEEIDVLEKRLENLKHDKDEIISNRDNETYELQEQLRQEREKSQELTRQLQAQQNQQQFEARTGFPPKGN